MLKSIIQKNYGLEIDSLQALEGGFRNQCFKVVTPGKLFLLIVYKKERGIKKVIENAHCVAKILSARSFPTRIPIMTRSDKEYVRQKLSDGYHYLALYNFLPGATIPWEGYTRRHLKSMGKTLSDMHYALRQSQNSKLKTQKLQVKIPNWSDITKNEVVKMKKYFKKVEPWIKKKLGVKLEWDRINEVFDKLEEKGDKPFGFARFDYAHRWQGKQNVLHYDFVRGNVLFSKRLDKKLDIHPITGILDFEKVCIGPEIADIARTLAFLIIDCKFKGEKTVRKRFLISGYARRGKNELPFCGITDVDLEILLKFFWLKDFWKFLVYNPYEYLHLNKHYLRTRERLFKADIVKKIIK